MRRAAGKRAGGGTGGPPRRPPSRGRSRSPASRDKPRGPSNLREGAGLGAGGDRVPEVVARRFLLVVGQAPPGGRSRRAGGMPTARAAAATQPAASPWAARPSTGSPVASNRAAASRSRPLEEADHPAGLGPVAGGGEGDRDGRRVARPDVGPAVAGAGDRRPGAAVGQCPEHEQRAPVHPPRPGRRTAPRAAGTRPASACRRRPIGSLRAGGRRWRCGRRTGRRSAARWSRAGSSGGPSRRRQNGARARPRCARATIPESAGTVPAAWSSAGIWTSGRPRPERANVDDVSVGVDRPDGPPVPDEGGAEERGRHAGNRRRGCRVGPRPPRESEGRDDADAYSRCRTSPVHPPMQSAVRPAGR